MSDIDNITITGELPGSLSPRNVDTVHYVVRKSLPRGTFNVGDKFSAWPWGTVLAQIIGRGPICTLDDLSEWEKAGMIERKVDG
jgi:hypothetical protein